MDPSALLTILPAAFQGITGINQMNEAKRTLSSLERPMYQIPEEVSNMLALAQANAQNQRFAGQSQAEDQTALGMANALNALRGGGGQGGVNVVQAEYNRGMNNIAAEAARQNRADSDALSQALLAMAGYKDTQWQMNKFAPYSEKYNESREMLGAGQQNVMGALGQLAAIGSGVAGNMSGMGNNPDIGITARDAASSTSSAKNQNAWIYSFADQMQKMAGQASFYQNQMNKW